MQERLDWIKRTPASWANWSPLRGGLQAHALVAQHYPLAEVHLVEPVPAQADAARAALQPERPWWQKLARQAAPAPQWHVQKPPQAVDMVWSNMQLHLSDQPQQLMRDWCDSLQPDGFLMFSCLGPDTARELRAIYRAQGWPPASHELTDMHDWGDMLVQSGFAEPVMDMERIVLTYASPQRLLQELRELGRNLHPQRFAGLRGRAWLQRLQQQLGAVHAVTPEAAEPEAGRLALTFEVIYGHAFKAPPKVPVGGTSSIGLDDMRNLLKSGRKPLR